MKKSLKWMLLSGMLIAATSTWGQFNFNSITSSSNNHMTQTLSGTSTLVVTAYKLVGDYYNQMSVCPQADQFAMNTTQLPEVLSITNLNNCVVLLKFKPASMSSTTPIPLAGTTIAVAPQYIVQSNGTGTLNFNSPAVFANFFDSTLLKSPPPCGTPISTLSNSSYGVEGVYAPDPATAATNEVMSGNGCI